MTDLQQISVFLKNTDWHSIKFTNLYGIADKYQAQFPTEIEVLRSKIQSLKKPGSKEWKQWMFVFEGIFPPLNRIHFENGLPKELLGIGIGFKLYRALIEQLTYACSEQNASESAKKVWEKLFNDKSLNCYRSNNGQYLAISLNMNENERLRIYETWENYFRAEMKGIEKIENNQQEREIVNQNANI